MSSSSLRSTRLSLVRQPERFRHADPATAQASPGDDQHNQREHVRHHGEQVGRHWDAEALQLKIQAVDETKDERSRQDYDRVPGTEDHKRDRDPATPAGHPFGTWNPIVVLAGALIF